MTQVTTPPRTSGAAPIPSATAIASKVKTTADIRDLDEMGVLREPYNAADHPAPVIKTDYME